MPRWLAHLIVVALFAAGIALAFWRVGYAWNWAGVWDYRQKFVQGWLTTVGLSLAALVASIAIGGGERSAYVQVLGRAEEGPDVLDDA